MSASSPDVLRLCENDRRRHIARRVRDLLFSEFRNYAEQPVRLPDEGEITTGYGVSRNVVRESLRLLADEDRVARNPRSGTYTRGLPNYSSDRLLDFTNPVQDEPARATAEVLGFTIVDEVPMQMRKVFELSPSVLHLAVCERRSHHDGQIRGLHTYYVPLHENESMTRDDVAGDIYGVIEARFGRRVESALRMVSAIAADASSAELLETPIGSPLLFVTSFVRSPDSEVLLVNYSRVRHDKLTLTFHSSR